jgi:type IV pilus assembly protein PilE
METKAMIPGRKSLRGFTLVELMIVVAVVGILAAVAYPSYQESVRKGRRAGATADLAEIAQNLERHFTINNTYATFTIAAPFNRSPRSGPVFYNISFVATPARTTYVLRAVPTGVQTGDRCGTFTLSNTGAKTVSGATIGECW